MVGAALPTRARVQEPRLRCVQQGQGNVVEACVGAGFLEAHELAAFRAPAASGATIPRFHFRTEPPEALAQFAAIFPEVE